MSIKYALFPNRLTDGSNQYRAVTHVNGSQNLEKVIERMVRLGSTITEADIRAVVTELVRAIEDMLVDGQRVNFGGLVQMWPGVIGNFAGKQDSFDPSRHRLSLNAAAGRRLLEAFRRRSEPERVVGVPPAPVVFDFDDYGSDTLNNILTPGDSAMITGNRLKFNPDADDEGVFFINAADSVETRSARFKRNKPGELIVRIPEELPEDASFRVEVRARMPKSEILRMGALEELLTS